MTRQTPSLSAVVVHWRDEQHLGELVAAWPRDSSFELLVVDNSQTLGELPPPARRLVPDRNLGFAGGVNFGTRAAGAPWILILNADTRPEDDALSQLVAATQEFPEAAGIVPALFGPDGESQHRWQLQPLPSPGILTLQTLLLSKPRGPEEPPARGSAIEQPAAAALALRKDVLDELGGFDEGFSPAWFEDVDIARRLARAGQRLIYEPRSRFRHAGGATVPTLGYGPFLWIYNRNLLRYLRLHHGRGWATLAGVTLPLGMLLRLAALPLRRPRRAASRWRAAVGLLAVVAGALSGWRWPASYRRRFTRKER
ncbi:MAG: glycosyltransferase family 2 protein [Acidobacteriota bacterium]